MIRAQLMPADGIVMVTPEAPLAASDFAQLAAIVDPYIAAHGQLHGLLIDAQSFPGWDDFAGLVAHFRFVRNHHQKVQRIAVVTDSTLLTLAPKLAAHFVQAEVREFPYAQRDAALQWLKSGHAAAAK